MWVTVISIVIGVFGTVPNGLERGIPRRGEQIKNRYYLDYSIDQNTEKIPADLKRIPVFQIPEKLSRTM